MQIKDTFPIESGQTVYALGSGNAARYEKNPIVTMQITKSAENTSMQNPTGGVISLKKIPFSMWQKTERILIISCFQVWKICCIIS